MSCLRPSAQRTIAVRLADVPIEKRRFAASLAIRDEHDPMERLRIKLLAEFPPKTLVAWIRP